MPGDGRRPQGEGRRYAAPTTAAARETRAAPTTAAVRDLFNANARRYDRVNRVITFGQDSRWRRWAARQAMGGAQGPRHAAGVARATCPPQAPRRVLDACAGTGLVGLEVARLGAQVTLADVSDGMLAVARERAAARRLTVDDCVVDLAAAPPPFAPASFDAAILAFGLRYFRDPVAAVGNIATALRPGAALVVVEAVVPPPGPAHRAAEVYFMRVAPLIATALAGHSALYRVLTATTRGTGGATGVLEIVHEAGLDMVTRRDFAVGLVVGIVARKPR